MAEDRGTLRAISWFEVFPGLRLFSALRLALRFRALLLAAVGLVLVSAGWHATGWLFSDSTNDVLRQHIAANDSWPWDDPIVAPSLGELLSPADWREQSPLLIAWQQLTAPFSAMFDPGITISQFAYLLTGSLWSLLVWALFGGAISRQAAMMFSRQENVSWKQLIRFVVPRWPAYFVAPLFPIGGVFLMAAGLALVGLLLRSGPGLLVAGIFWWLVLFVGFLMAFLLLGLFFGWPLMWGTISAEGTDSFGALSHSYSYVYQRPLQYLLYATSAAVIGMLGWYLVSLFTLWIIDLSDWGVSWGSTAVGLREAVTASESGTMAGYGALLIRFWTLCLFMLVTAFLISYLWSATTVIYFLLRRLVDGVELDEVFTPEERALHSLPPLKTGADGVAEPADEPEGARQ